MSHFVICPRIGVCVDIEDNKGNLNRLEWEKEHFLIPLIIEELGCEMHVMASFIYSFLYYLFVFPKCV